MPLIHIPIKRICAEEAFGVKYSRGWQRPSSTVYCEPQNKGVVDDEGKEVDFVRGVVLREADAVLEQPVTSAATVQDAINAVVAERKQGCTMIAVPSGGYGFVATGIGTYRKNMDNVTAERIAQRNAYVEAYMQAKSQMASLLGEMAVRGACVMAGILLP